MEQFMVPQFIDIESKIIGPITVRQFIICLVGALFIFIEYKLADFWLFVVLALLTLGVFGTVAFLRINGRPFHYFILNFIQTIKRPRLRVWNKELSNAEIKALAMEFNQAPKTPEVKQIKEPLRGSRLSELSLVVNTGGAYKAEEPQEH